MSDHSSNIFDSIEESQQPEEEHDEEEEQDKGSSSSEEEQAEEEDDEPDYDTWAVTRKSGGWSQRTLRERSPTDSRYR